MKIFRTGRGSLLACDRVSFEVPEGRFFTLLGPSGCGETTTLRCIAPVGSTVVVFVRPDEGWDATVTQAVFLGECVDCRLAVGDVELRARIHPSVRVRRGDQVRVSFRSDRCVAVRLEASGGTL